MANSGNYGVTPYLLSPECENHISWLERTLGAKVNELHHDKETNKIMHACISVNGGNIAMADASFASSKSDEKEPTRNERLGVHVMCCMRKSIGEGEKQWNKALDNGAKSKMKYKKQETWDGYLGIFEDPFGFEWMITEYVDEKPAEDSQVTA